MHYEEILKERGVTIDKDGRVFNKDGIELNGRIKCGYKTIALRVNGKKSDVKVHRYQAYMKYGDKLYENGIVVRHLNNNKLDNSWDNIAIGSYKDNSMDNPLEERLKYAIKASKAANKYTKEFVEKIRKEYSDGLTYKDIIDKYNLPKSSLSYIINNSYKVHK